LIIVNLEETDYDSQATLVIRSSLGKFAEAVMSSEYKR